jgi:hypothetical protein
MPDNPINPKLDKLIKDAHSKYMTLSASCPACEGGTLNSVFAEDVGKDFQVTLRCSSDDCFYEAVVKTLPQDDFELVSLSNEEAAIFYGDLDADDDQDED